MALEGANSIAQLNSAWPLGQDAFSQGDDHLRLIKAVLKNAFPGVGGQGFSVPITATEQELNHSSGLVDNTQSQLDALSARMDTLEAASFVPSGTKMVFFQASVPLGWTQDITANDAMLRVVNGVGGGVGGSDSPILMDKVPAHTHTTAASGIHSHTVSNILFREGGIGEVPGGGPAQFTDVTTSSDGSHTHNVLTNPGASNWTPKYINIVVGIYG